MTKSPHPSSVDKGELLPVTVETTEYPIKHLPMALREVAENVLVECELHVLEDMARIANQAADVIEGNQAHSLPGMREALEFIEQHPWHEREAKRVLCIVQDTAGAALRAALTPSATISEASNWVTTVICATCGGEFDEGEWDADTRCPECEEPKRWNEKRTKLLGANPPKQAATPSALSGDAGEGE